MDIGAYHPTLDNNTYFFYNRGWRGMNLEPHPELHQLFTHVRPEDINLKIAVSNQEGEFPFYVIPDYKGLCTLSPEIAIHHRQDGFNVQEIKVRVTTVRILIQEYHIKPPDIVSIDVEGHEYEVIKGIPLKDWRPKVFVVESTIPNSRISNYQKWEPLMHENGYLFAAFNGVNRFYLREDLRNKLKVLEVPVNSLDNYKTAEVIELEERIKKLESCIQTDNS